MRIAVPLVAAMLVAMPALPAAAQDPVADTIIRNLTRGIRLPAPGSDSVTAPITPLDTQGPVQSATTDPGDRPAVSLMVTFATGSAALTPEAEVLIASLARAFAAPELANARFRIEGHTDTVGDGSMNQALSEARAAAVRDHLVHRHGVAPARLQTIGYGETRPLVPTADERDEPRNRRVQVVNLGN
ncbi:OmpA family protein [Roseomonas sp. HF4]|uniref:OmpA family protein n=1 Tax=Roseomonas sp. HF4 TaxID=2562313 RepID=UPI001484F42A|nr:OmpA family protein [Roseomonas sp. HF4]